MRFETKNLRLPSVFRVEVFVEEICGSVCGSGLRKCIRLCFCVFWRKSSVEGFVEVFRGSMEILQGSQWFFFNTSHIVFCILHIRILSFSHIYIFPYCLFTYCIFAYCILHIAYWCIHILHIRIFAYSDIAYCIFAYCTVANCIFAYCTVAHYVFTYSNCLFTYCIIAVVCNCSGLGFRV